MNILVKYFLVFVFIFSTINVYSQNKDSINSTIDQETILNNQQTAKGKLFDLPKELSTHSISNVKGEELDKGLTSNLTNSLAGRLSGLGITQNTDRPMLPIGMESISKMNVRGKGTFGMVGNHTFKTYIDGFETDLGYLLSLPVSFIGDITVLKDAASLVPFGLEGSEGVIWVTTKRGEEGNSKVFAQIKGGIQRPIEIVKPLGAVEYSHLYNQAISNDNGNIWTPKYTSNYFNLHDQGLLPDVDWRGEALKKYTSYKNADVSFLGGDENVKYNASIGYTNQEGLYNIKNTDTTSNERLNRFSFLANLDLKFLKIFEAKLGLNGGINDFKGPNYGAGSFWNNIASYPSNIYPAFDGINKWSGTSTFPDNPIASILAQGWTGEQLRNINVTIDLKERLDFILPGLYLREAVNFQSYGSSVYGKVASYARYHEGAVTTTDLDVPITANPLTPGGQSDRKQMDLGIGYSNMFGKNRISSAFSFSQKDFTGNGFVKYKIHSQNLNGRFNYAFDNRYIGELGMSYYGSDAYYNKWSFYPAVSFAWILSNESFMSDMSFLDFLKMRTSFGKVGGFDGNTAFGEGRYLYQQYYEPSGSFYMGNSSPALASILTPNYLANKNVQGEESLKINFGLDIGLFKNLNLNLDWYLDHRSKILTFDNSIFNFYGDINSYLNVGEVISKGFELEGVYKNRFGDVEIEMNAIFNLNKNRIKYIPEILTSYKYNGITDRPINAPIGLIAEGFYDLDDFDNKGKLKSSLPIPAFGPVQPGDIKYRDLNGDDRIDEQDVTQIGYSNYPQLIYSFGAKIDWKDFDLSFLLIGNHKVDVNLLSKAGIQMQAFVDNNNAFPIAKNAWAYYPDQGIDTRSSATYPRLTTMANNNNYRNSTFWMKDASFLRLHNVELGYDFSNRLVKNPKVMNFRVFVNATNLLTISSLFDKYGFDPESIADFPMFKSFSVGASIGF